MNDMLLIERLPAEIQKASTAGERARARKLAALQREVLARLMRDMAVDPPGDFVAVPLTPRQGVDQVPAA